METKQYATEGGHWYHRDGTTCYEVEKSDGTMRPTTLRDAKKLNLVPSVTTVLQILNKPGLEKWKGMQILLSAATSPLDRNKMSADEWAAKIYDDSIQQQQNAMSLGTTIHAEIEKGIASGSISVEFEKYVGPVIDGMRSNGWLENTSVEKSFAHPMGYGGKVDFINYDPQIIADFKTSAFDSIDKHRGWPEHLYQLVAYRELTGLHDADLYNIYISTTVPGLFYFKKYDEDEIGKSLAIWHLTLELWKAIKL